MTEPAKALPRYRSHKMVEALKIKDFDLGSNGTMIINPVEEGYGPIIIPEKFIPKHRAAIPANGWYWVRYSDSYESFSPAAAFEEGYTLITEDKVPSPGEAVYGWFLSSNWHCGGCGGSLKMYFSPLCSRGGQTAPRFMCSGRDCPRKGKLYELSTAHAVILREVEQSAALEAK